VPSFVAPATATRAVTALAALVADDVAAMDDDTCLGLFDALENIDRLFHSARFALLAELDARNLTDRRFGHTVANQAGWRHGTDPRRTKRDLKTANTLRRSLPTVAAALAEATVSVDRAPVLAAGVNERNRDTIAATQAELLNLAAQQSTFAGFCRDIEQVMRLADLDGAEPPQPRNHASVARTGDQVTATFDLYGPAAISFAEQLNTEANRLFRRWTTDHEHCADIDIPPRSELLAQAAMNLINSGAAHRHTGRTTPTSDINIVIDVNEASLPGLFADHTLLPGPAHAGPIDWSKHATDLTGTRLRHSTREWELLTCDPTYTWILTAADGHPVACRTGERHANRQQRRALHLRDGRCVFPGCDAPADWCDAHHIQPHTNGGPTETRNLALLCKRHHGVIHRTGWTMTVADTAPGSDTRAGTGAGTPPGDSNATGDNFFLITSPTGIVLNTQHARGPERNERRERQRRHEDATHHDQQPHDQRPHDQQPHDQQHRDQQPHDQQPHDQQHRRPDPA